MVAISKQSATTTQRKKIDERKQEKKLMKKLTTSTLSLISYHRGLKHLEREQCHQR